MPNHWFSREGHGTGAVYGYAHWLRRFLIEQKPTYVAACFDESLGTCFRNQVYPGYKGRRPQADENLKFQLRACRQITELMGVPTYASQLYEADDLIGTLLHKHRRVGRGCTIITSDKDLGQLLGAEDILWDYPKAEPLDAQAVGQKFGVPAADLAEYLALCGDAIDDIPGVQGIGAKTASHLISYFGSIEKLLCRLQDVPQVPVRGAAQIATKLAQFETQIRMALQLTRINCNAPIAGPVRLKIRKVNLPALQNFAAELGFALKPIKE